MTTKSPRAVLINSDQWNAFLLWATQNRFHLTEIRTAPGQLPRYTLSAHPTQTASVGARDRLQHMTPGLTQRECDVVVLLCQGLSNDEIARRLTLSYDTVKTHMRQVRKKLGARDRAHIVTIVHQCGLLPTIIEPVPARSANHDRPSSRNADGRVERTV